MWTDSVLWITEASIAVGILLVLARAILGPTVYDRILAVNTIGTKTVLLVTVLAFLGGRPEYLDIALLYTLINFIATIAILKFREYGRLG